MLTVKPEVRNLAATAALFSIFEAVASVAARLASVLG
jgi:hypothetical protein